MLNLNWYKNQNWLRFFVATQIRKELVKSGRKKPIVVENTLINKIFQRRIWKVEIALSFFPLFPVVKPSFRTTSHFLSSLLVNKAMEWSPEKRDLEIKNTVLRMKWRKFSKYWANLCKRSANTYGPTCELTFDQNNSQKEERGQNFLFQLVNNLEQKFKLNCF